MTHDLMRLHKMSVEATAARYFAQTPEVFEESQRETLLRLVNLQSTTSETRDPELTFELGKVLTGACSGISGVWVHPDFISPVIARATFNMLTRLDLPGVGIPRPVYEGESRAAYGVRLTDYRMPPDLAYFDPDSRTLFVQATVRATQRTLIDPLFLLEALGEEHASVHPAS